MEGLHRLGQPVHLLAGEEAERERRFGRRRRPARRCDGRLRLVERQPCMIEEGLARGRQFDAARAAGQQLRADFMFEIANVPAERRLCGVQPLLGGKRQAADVRHGDEVTEMPQLHIAYHACEVCIASYKVFLKRARAA